MWLFDDEEDEDEDIYKVDYNQNWLKFITYVYFNGGFGELREGLDHFVIYPFCPLIRKEKSILLLWKEHYWSEILSEMVDIYLKTGELLPVENLHAENTEDTIKARIKLPVSRKVLTKMRQELENFYFWSTVQDKDIRAVKHLMHSIFEVCYKMYWLEFELDIHKIDRIFEGDDLLYSLARLYLSGFIHFEWEWLSLISEEYATISLIIKIDPSLEKILNANISNKEILIETAFSGMYTKFSVTKKNWEIKMLERDVEFAWDNTKFVELQKKYPHSEIKAKNYKGKATKYEVREKIKLNNLEQE